MSWKTTTQHWARTELAITWQIAPETARRCNTSNPSPLERWTWTRSTPSWTSWTAPIPGFTRGMMMLYCSGLGSSCFLFSEAPCRSSSTLRPLTSRTGSCTTNHWSAFCVGLLFQHETNHLNKDLFLYTFTARIGGWMGLAIGASAISIFEILGFMCYFICTYPKKYFQNWSLFI